VVEVAQFQGDVDDVVFVLSHEMASRTATLTTERVVASVTDVRGGKTADVGTRSFGVPLGPNGAAVLRLTYG